MDIRQGKIRNINRKIIAGSLVFSLTMSAVIGYNVSKHIKLERQKYENFTGVVSFEKMKKCFFVEIYNKQEETMEYYIVQKYENFNKNGEIVGYSYLDLLEQKNVFIDRLANNTNFGFEEACDKTLVEELNMEEYLYSLKKIETMYSDEDIKGLIDQMKQMSSNKTR